MTIKKILPLSLPFALACNPSAKVNEQNKEKKTNFVIIFTDDQGYADVGCYGAKGFETPNLDTLAANGLRLTDFYVASPVSSPSRAALLTGCYPQRVSIPEVLGPKGPDWTKNKYMNGLDTNEVTIADMLKTVGYTTACFGKWHLGHYTEFLPTNNGFDEYLGLPYSNDMWPENEDVYPPLPLIKGTEVIDTIEGNDQKYLNKRYTEAAIDFIKRKSDTSFFLYLAHSMPHTPIFASEKFEGKSDLGLYGDVIEEIDWSVGQIVKTLKEEGLFENTVIIFSSDNGPWAEFGNHAGHVGQLRGSKGTTFEGGMRVPCIISWPEVIKTGAVSSEIVSTIDVLPTFAEITGADLPKNKIDGLSFLSLIKDSENAKSGRDEFWYLYSDDFQAIRMGDWKYHKEHKYRKAIPKNNGERGTNEWPVIEESLFNLKEDITESKNLASEHPELIEEFRSKLELYDSLLKAETRPCGVHLEK